MVNLRVLSSEVFPSNETINVLEKVLFVLIALVIRILGPRKADLLPVAHTASQVFLVARIIKWRPQRLTN